MDNTLCGHSSNEFIENGFLTQTPTHPPCKMDTQQDQHVQHVFKFSSRHIKNKKKQMKLITVIPQYPSGIGPRTPADTKSS